MRQAEASSPSDAGTLSLNSGWSSDHYLTETDNEHWYKMVVPSDGKVQIKIMHYMYSVHLQISTSDLSDNFFSESSYNGSETSPKTGTFDCELSKGTYYLKITGYDGRYKMNATYYSYGTKDQNAYSYDNPQSFVIGQQMVGALTYTDTEDWYKFNVSKASTYVLKLTHYTYRVDYKLYNQDLSVEVESSDSYNGSETAPKAATWEIVLSPGTYYIKITGYRGKYLMDMSSLNQSNCSHDYVTSYVDATYLAKGYTLHKCKKCGKSYKDNYIGKKTLGKGYIWNFGGITAGKRKFTVTYQSISDVSGYQIRYSTNKQFKKSVKIVKAGKNTTTKTIKKLKKRKRYYVQVRGYKKVRGKIVYGKWSGKRSVKTK